MGKGCYLRLLENGELGKRVKEASKRLSSCNLCPHECGVDRTKGEKGFCQAGSQARIANYGAHFGEEPPLVGKRGSGTVFFSWCNMRCVFCQNYDISHQGSGFDVTAEFLAFCFLSLQEGGCHNINLVTPSHMIPQILKALLLAASEGLSIPLVYNTGGYDSLETLKLIDGIVDIYMPDFKYWDEATARRLSKVKGYPGIARQALREMHRQVGILRLDENGIAQRGLLVRHLVLPEGLAGTRDVLDFISKEISPKTCVNIMDQYRPCGMASKYPPLDRRITRQEYLDALEEARKAGLKRLAEF